MPNKPRPHELPPVPNVSAELREAVEHDYQRFPGSQAGAWEPGPPDSLETYVSEQYGLDVASEYAGCELRNPWGKASGQLSMTARQVAEDVEAGLGFVVLKTVIALDDTGSQSMKAWAIKESRMLAEPIVGRSGQSGWTISWKGRGWWQTFEEYLELIRQAQQMACGTGTLIVPSCKYHLPTPDEGFWKVEEYEFTTPRILEAWREQTEHSTAPMPLEKDFSPTLAGSGRSTQQAQILEWLRTVPVLVRKSVSSAEDPDSSNAATPAQPDSPSPLRLGLKIFNALFDDEFQLEMLRAIHRPGSGRPDFYIYGNRLFDPDREFDGHQGIAYGGPDLSDRNLRVMTQFQHAAEQGSVSAPLLPWSATGDITTGKMALEYALRGAGSFQLHTFFQLPTDQYHMTLGSKTQKALHELYFHPQTGFVIWMRHLAAALNLPTEPIRFRDVIGKGLLLRRVDR